MIKDEDGLRITRERLRETETALDALRQELGHNPVQYKLFSDGLVEMIRSMRSDIDVYLGLAPSPASAVVTIALEGKDVALGHTSAGLITRFVDSFRRGLQSVVEVLDSSTSTGGRRRAQWIEKACDLPLLGVAPGSVQVILGKPEVNHLFSDIEQQNLTNAFDLMFVGLEWAAGETEPDSAKFDSLPDSTRKVILDIVTRLLPPRIGPVEQVAFVRPDRAGRRQVRRTTLGRGTRQRVRDELTRLANDRRFTDAEGVIRSVDLDAQQFVLRERPGSLPDLPCEYGPQTEEAVKEFLDCRVIVSGILETNRANQKQRMQVEAIELIAGDGQTDDEVTKSIE